MPCVERRLVWLWVLFRCPSFYLEYHSPVSSLIFNRRVGVAALTVVLQVRYALRIPPDKQSMIDNLAMQIGLGYVPKSWVLYI